MIYIRVDDFPGTKPEEFWKHNLENYRKFDEVLRRYVPNYILGVIPRHTSIEHLEWLKSNPSVEIALHGINHDESRPNEFSDWETVTQRRKSLSEAKLLLSSYSSNGLVDTYIPPHNVLDTRTCNALKDAGFTRVLVGPGCDDPKVFEYAKHINLPLFYSQHPWEYGRSDELLNRDSAVTIIEQYLEKRDIYLTLHWTWEWNIGLKHLDRFLYHLGPMLRHGRN